MHEQFEQYRPTHLESAIVDFYRKNGVRSPQDIDLDYFVQDAGIWLHYVAQPTSHYQFKQGRYTIVVDRRITWERQRTELAHELGHCLLHSGRQEFMNDDFRALQEWQADRFAMFALVPTFMIANCITQTSSHAELVDQLSYIFDVPAPFMDARLHMLEQRFQALAAERQMSSAIREASAGYDYSFRHPVNHKIEYLVRDGSIIGQRRRAEL